MFIYDDKRNRVAMHDYMHIKDNMHHNNDVIIQINLCLQRK